MQDEMFLNDSEFLTKKFMESITKEDKNIDYEIGSKGFRECLQREWIEFVSQYEWSNFITLTFREEKHHDIAMALFEWWIRENNKSIFGSHYTRIVGHSYFSYLYGIEAQVRGVLHFHVLVDKPINYALTHKIWGDRCGFAWIINIQNQKEEVIKYVTKYILKGGELGLYETRSNKLPIPKPIWWQDQLEGKLVQKRNLPL